MVFKCFGFKGFNINNNIKDYKQFLFMWIMFVNSCCIEK